MKKIIAWLFSSPVKDALRQWWKYYRPSLFDRYILRQFILVSVFSLFFIVVLYEVVQVFQFLRWFPADTRPWDVFVMKAHEGAYWMMIFLPLAFALGAVVVFTRLANHHELRAMVTTGISLRRIMFYPLFFMALLALFFIFFFQENVIFPLYQRYFAYRKMVFDRVALQDIERLRDNQNVVVYGPYNTLYMGDRYSALSKKLENVVILSLIPQNAPMFVISQVVSNEYLMRNLQIIEQQRFLDVLEQINFTMRIDAQSMVWNEDHWILYDGTLWTIDTVEGRVRAESFSNFTTNILTIRPYYLERIWYGTVAMRPSQLRSLINLRKKSGQFHADLEATWYSNISYMVNAFFLVLLIVGFIDISKKKISLVENLVICFVSFGVAYIVFAMGASFAANGDLPPIVGGFLGSFFLGGVSLWMFRRLPT